MKTKEFRNITVDLNNKSFSIHKGSIGTYDYREISYCKIVYEEDKYKGKSPMFSHIINRNSLVASFILQGNVWCGIKIEMRNGNILYAYISNMGTQYNSLQFHDDTRKAEEFIRFINKHKVYFKNIRFDTDYKTFSIARGDAGTYPYTEIKKCKVEIEYESYSDISQFASFSMNGSENKASIKILFYMKNEEVLQAYISSKPQILNSRYFYMDQRIAEDVKKLVKKIVKKYA